MARMRQPAESLLPGDTLDHADAPGSGEQSGAASDQPADGLLGMQPRKARSPLADQSSPARGMPRHRAASSRQPLGTARSSGRQQGSPTLAELRSHPISLLSASASRPVHRRSRPGETKHRVAPQRAGPEELEVPDPMFANGPDLRAAAGTAEATPLSPGRPTKLRAAGQQLDPSAGGQADRSAPLEDMFSPSAGSCVSEGAAEQGPAAGGMHPAGNPSSAARSSSVGGLTSGASSDAGGSFASAAVKNTGMKGGAHGAGGSTDRLRPASSGGTRPRRSARVRGESSSGSSALVSVADSDGAMRSAGSESAARSRQASIDE